MARKMCAKFQGLNSPKKTSERPELSWGKTWISPFLSNYSVSACYSPLLTVFFLRTIDPRRSILRFFLQNSFVRTASEYLVHTVEPFRSDKNRAPFLRKHLTIIDMFEGLSLVETLFLHYDIAPALDPPHEKTG